MTSEAKLITDLLKVNGKSASKMTQALKLIGDGDMQSGLTRVADYLLMAGKKAGAIKGATGAAAAAIAIYAIVHLVKKVIEKNKNLKVEGEAILRGLEEGLSDNVNKHNEDFISESNPEEANK